MAQVDRPRPVPDDPARLGTDPLLGRPFALYDVARDASGAAVGLDVVYLVLGRGTAALAGRRPGDRLVVWGPLGNGFGPPPEGPVVFVAGGIGQTPFLALGRWWLGRASYGEGLSPLGRAGGPVRDLGDPALRRPDRRAGRGRGRFSRRAGIAVELATDDGSAGHHGFVTDLLARRLERGERPAKVVGCGPPAMLADPRAGWSRVTRCPATCRWRTTWPAASGPASVASPRSARRTARSTSGGSASRGRSSPRPT